MDLLGQLLKENTSNLKTVSVVPFGFGSIQISLSKDLGALLVLIDYHLISWSYGFAPRSIRDRIELTLPPLILLGTP
jgi:hypothetical protein